VKQLLGKLALSGITVFLCLFVAERGLRAIGYEYRPMSVKVGRTDDARYFHLFGDRHFVYDPDLIWRPKPGYEIFNDQGFRGPELTRERQPGVLRLFAIGDSNTLGWAGVGGPNWPAVIDRLLHQAGHEAEVVNGGVWGYSSFQGVRRLREVLVFQPDIVLVSYGSNDAHLVRRTDDEFSGKSSRFRDFERWFNHYRLGQLITAASHRMGGRGENALRPRVGLGEYEDNLGEMARLAREVDVQLVFLTRPFTGPIADPSWWKNFAYDYNAATVKVGTAKGIPVIDVYSYFKNRDEYFSDESHFTEAGHELAGRLVFTDLQPMLEASRVR
jgi:lysophospholipase L1-like esterase